MLSVHSMEYLEQIEHQFTDVQDQLKSIIVKLIKHWRYSPCLHSPSSFILRVFELKRTTSPYQEAADKAEKANEAKSLFLATMSRHNY
ncbi:hypothetical protein O9993_03830 [Vibrio lentus]|nr:hypothetical protein [Vibrio lentus]